MRNKVSKKVVGILSLVLILSFSLGAMVFADDNFQTLEAWFGHMQIFRNNQQVQLSADPFIVNGSTYVPLRAMSELFDKEVLWDGINYRIDLNDKPDENLAHMTQELVEAQVKVLELEAKVAQLEADLKTKEETSKKGDLGSLEKQLNRDHGTYKKVKFDIDLYEGRSNVIDVDIYVDIDYDYYDWNDLTTANIKSYIQDIVDDILYEYRNADVRGYIKDSSDRNKEVVSFTTKSNGTVDVDTNYKGGSGGRYSDLSDLENDLNRNYDRYNSRKGYVYFKIELTGDKDDIRAYITADYDDLYYLTQGDIKDYLEEIHYQIEKDFPKAYVDGYIEDDYDEYYFDFDSSGRANLR